MWEHEGCEVTDVTAAAAPVTPSDLTGCRYRRVLNRALRSGRVSPELSPGTVIDRTVSRYRARLRRSAVAAALPRSPRFGERLVPTRVDVVDDGTAEEQTLEALAAGVRLIVGGRLADGALSCDADLLVRTDPGAGPAVDMTYMPVTVTAHTVSAPGKAPGRALSKAPNRTPNTGVRVVDVAALGLARPLAAGLKHRSTPVDSQKVAVAHALLDVLGLASGDVGFIGADLARCLVIPAERVVPGLVRALEAPVPDEPTRVRECGTCEFHNHCRARLLRTGDLSLMLPGDRAERWRERGIDTLAELAAADHGETSALASAWLAGVGYLRRPLRRWIVRPDLWCGHTFRMPERLLDGDTPMAGELADAVEIDVDMEAHPSRGTFLWGTFDGAVYRSFTDFGTDGDGGRHVASFWTWLSARRDAATREGRACRVYCYSRQGENHWLRHYARDYGGTRYALADGREAVMPTLSEVNVFLESGQWVDVFDLVRSAVAANSSLGLKAVAPLAGFTFSQDDVDGRVAVDLFEVAVGGDGPTASAAQRTLERYNADDCFATAAVRTWLRRGAPGIPALSQPLERV
ncbi:ribonuclease H-like domain-containing protein [Corynebacterium sp. USCH3]|uniref:ribonuclease H-like domain-containing protein n=1 Tax=Corynebacterium sp. USCH3 TaxID=3024840 RepID=UPI0030AA4854